MILTDLFNEIADFFEVVILPAFVMTVMIAGSVFIITSVVWVPFLTFGSIIGMAIYKICARIPDKTGMYPRARRIIGLVCAVVGYAAAQGGLLILLHLAEESRDPTLSRFAGNALPAVLIAVLLFWAAYSLIMFIRTAKRTRSGRRLYLVMMICALTALVSAVCFGALVTVIGNQVISSM